MPQPNLSKAMVLIGKAVERVLSNEKRAAQVAKAVGAVQRGKEKLDRAQESLLRSIGYAGKADYKDVGKRISAIRRRVKHLAEKLER